MSPLWLVPGLVVLIGGAAIVGLLRSAAEESRLLLDELVRQREVGQSLRRLDESLRSASGVLRDRK
ncbi:MAG TPA: hypothetical protein VFU93_07360 [Acidimicrobiales bacterium]|nr:hypothetical protein [Acidimicrobiales bacterium]